MDKVTDFTVKYKNPIYIGLAIIIICLVLWYISSRRNMMNFMSVSQMAPMEPFAEKKPVSESQDQMKVVLFFAPWCPHCKNLMAGDDSIWEKLKRKHGHRRNLQLDQVNCDEQPDLATKFGIKGFPTILKFKKDGVAEFSGDRTLEALEGFVDSD